MGRAVDVEINKVNALITLGSMYRNAADAIKEYVSNALDEWALARAEGKGPKQCQVSFDLSKDSIIIDYNAPGMDEAGFEDALKHVVDSPKEGRRTPQIGRLGIGLWAFNQVGTRAAFYSKRTPGSPTIKVLLSRDSSQAQFLKPGPGEERKTPGMAICISGLFQDPTRRYGPLSQARLKHVLANKFDVYLRSGQLRITIRSSKVETEVEPVKVDLPEIGIGFQEMSLPRNPKKTFRTRFWFDPSGNGRIAIRHTGVVVIDDLSSPSEYDLGDTILTSGMIKGFVDAEFLRPLPARAQFVENQDLADLMESLRRIGSELEKEVSGFQEESTNERLQGMIRRATRVAREVLSQEEFLDLQLLEGLNRLSLSGNGDAKHAKKATTNGRNGHGHANSEPRQRVYHQVIRQMTFDGDLRHHSRLSQGTIEINTSNPDFIALSRVPRSHQVAYIAMLLGKEIIAYNDTTHVSDEALEKMAAYNSRVLARVWR